MKSNHLDYLIKATALFAIYLITARIGLTFDAVSGFATLVWPPSGIALAALLILGHRFWPSIFLAATLVNFITGAPLLVAVGIGTGNMLEALLGAYLLNRFVKFQHSLERVKDVLGLIILAAFASTLVSATIGVTSLLLGDVILASSYSRTWTAWWIGDMLGNLVIAPLLLVWSTRLRSTIHPERFAKALVPTVLLIAVSIFVFRGFPWAGANPIAYIYILFPILIWIALRFGQRGSVTTTFIVSFIAIWSTVAGFGPFADNSLSQSLLYLQSFIAVIAVTFMIMAAVVSERERTQKSQQRLLQRTRLLTEQRARLLALNKAKDEFVAIASHQLRTPATTVKQYLGLLLEGYSDPLTKDQKTFAKTAYESNEMQLRTVDLILQIARLDLGKMKLNLKRHDIGKILDNAVSGLQNRFSSSRQLIQIVKPEKSVWGKVDNGQLRMVIENLVENALKYSAESKKTIVRLHQPTAGEIRITIEDEGIGIKSSDLKYLFKKFSRINNPFSNDVSGSGLGLYFCKKIIRLHGGNLRVASKFGSGSIFTIELPYQPRSRAKKV